MYIQSTGEVSSGINRDVYILIRFLTFETDMAYATQDFYRVSLA